DELHAILSSATFNRAVEPSPKPAALGTLAYALDGDVFVTDPAGTSAVKIADGRSAEHCSGAGSYPEYWAEAGMWQPGGSMWSPDGRYLAFRHEDCTSSGSSTRDVVITDAAGNVVATFPGAGWRVAWSPDSTRV